MTPGRPAAGQILCIYGDPAYPVRPQLMGPLKGVHKQLLIKDPLTRL